MSCETIVVYKAEDGYLVKKGTTVWELFDKGPGGYQAKYFGVSVVDYESSPKLSLIKLSLLPHAVQRIIHDL